MVRHRRRIGWRVSKGSIAMTASGPGPPAAPGASPPPHRPRAPPADPQEAGADSLPFQAAPHDALRQGLVTLKDGAAAVHPVDQIQGAGRAAGDKARMQMLANVYGAALPARMQIERQILERCARLAGGCGSGCRDGG